MLNPNDGSKWGPEDLCPFSDRAILDVCAKAEKSGEPAEASAGGVDIAVKYDAKRCLTVFYVYEHPDKAKRFPAWRKSREFIPPFSVPDIQNWIIDMSEQATAANRKLDDERKSRFPS
jgi:hypothetical protein